MNKVLLLLISAFILTSCTFTPKVVYDNDNGRCQLSTNKRTLELADISQLNCSGSSSEAAVVCLGAVTVYSAITAIVSGSIVLVGNTIHWLEKQGKCNDSLLQSMVYKHNIPLLEQNGKLIKPVNENPTPDP